MDIIYWVILVGWMAYLSFSVCCGQVSIDYLWIDNGLDKIINHRHKQSIYIRSTSYGSRVPPGTPADSTSSCRVNFPNNSYDKRTRESIVYYTILLASYFIKWEGGQWIHPYNNDLGFDLKEITIEHMDLID